MLVVVIDPMGGDAALEADELALRGHRLEILATDGQRRRSQLRQAVGVLATDAIVDRRLLESMPRCRVAATYGVGYDNIDVAAAHALGVVVTNVPDYCTSEVADHTIALMMALLRGVVPGNAMVLDGQWSLAPFASLRRIAGMQLGLIGLGRIGRAVAERARPFGFVVRAADPFLRGDPPDGIEMCTITELLAESDILSVHVPLTPDTRSVVSSKALATVRRGALLINTSRGGLVDLEAALDALASGQLGGLALDVFPEEPMNADVFKRGGNLVLTPHIAFYSRESMAEGRRSAARTIADVLDDREVPNRVR